MTTITLAPSAVLPVGKIIAQDVTAEDYMAHHAEHFREWVGGYVIAMSPESFTHANIVKYLENFLDIFVGLKSLGQVVDAPFVMRLDAVNAIREPDVQVILNDNPGTLTETAMIGPADICIEVVSPESVARDYGQKFEEYEKAGVREYWIIDPIRKDARFYRLQDTGLYAPAALDEDGHFTTSLLPGLRLHVPTLWREELPSTVEIVAAVQAMVEGM